MNMTESEKKLWLEGDSGLTPYLRQKDNGMPQNKINQIAWLLLSGSGCGFCKVCRDEPCNIKDGEKCTINIANYIRQIVLEENEQEIRANAIDEFAEKLLSEMPASIIFWLIADINEKSIFRNAPTVINNYMVEIVDKIAEQMKAGGIDE